MIEPVPPGPAQLLLTASVARRYYLDGRSKVEIADELGLSRFKVARLLDSARASGLVRIEIGYPGVIDVELSGRLQDAFGLRHAVVVDAADDDEPALRTQLGKAAAELLQEVLSVEDVLGLTWARSVAAMAMELTWLPRVPVVQLTGALTGADVDENSVELVRRVAKVAGGPAYFFYAPMVVADPATAHALRQQPEVANAFAQFASVTTAVAGIGMWAPGQSTVYRTASESDRAEISAQGICAEIAAVFLDADGALVPTRLAERVIGADGAALQHVPHLIGICYGRSKAPAVRAALRSGIVDSLVTHSSLAVGLLAPA